MSSLSSIYNSFSEQQKQFVDEKTISATLRIEKWLGFLAKTVKYDHKIDKEVSLMGTLTWVGVIGIIISIIAAFVAENPFIALGVLAFILLIIISQVRKSKLHSKDLDNYLRLFFIPVLSILSEKAGKDAKLSASLDFRIPRKSLTPTESKVRGRNLKLYEPKYIATRVLLKDGVSLEFAVKDDIKDYSWTKRSASGKMKYKSKTKFTHQCFLKMTLPKSEYELSRTPPANIIIEEMGESYVAKSKIKVKVIGTSKVLNPKKLFEGIQQIYDCFLSFRMGEEQPKKAERSDEEEYETEDYYENDDNMMLGAMMWHGDLFDRYDYDNFDYANSNEFMVDDDSVTVFDS